MPSPRDFKVGQTVWIKSRWKPLAPPYMRTVEKVGRKWIGLGGGERFDPSTLDMDGGEYSSPGRVYPSLDAYESEAKTKAAWRLLNERIDRMPMPDIDAIRSAASALGIKLEES